MTALLVVLALVVGVVVGAVVRPYVEQWWLARNLDDEIRTHVDEPPSDAGESKP